jgi:hypothetical protein
VSLCDRGVWWRAQDPEAGTWNYTKVSLQPLSIFLCLCVCTRATIDKGLVATACLRPQPLAPDRHLGA